MPRAFLSYSREDRRWVPLVKRLLDFHHVVAWLDTDSIQPGSDYKSALENAIGEADILLVVIAKGVQASKWITREITTFKASHPTGPIIPLIFESISPSEAFDGLEKYQSISFLEDLDSGFAKLFSYLSVEYLPEQDRRTSEGERRSGDRRTSDRRRFSAEQRLRRGLWIELNSKTGAGEYDPFGSTTPGASAVDNSTLLSFSGWRSTGYISTESIDVPGAIRKYARVLTEPGSEISRYTFHEKTSGELVEFNFDMIQEIFHRAYRHQETMGGKTLNIYVVEQVAFALAALFDIKSKDRREDDRRSASDRRLGR